MTAEEGKIVAFTVGCALAAVSAATPPALAAACLLAYRNFPGKSLLETLLTLPLVLPPVVTGLALLHLLRADGPLGSWGASLLFTPYAVILALAVMCFPLLLRSYRVALESIPDLLSDAASNLGGSPLRNFFRITLPLARRGLLSGWILGFARSLGEFGATILVAGFVPGVTETLPLAIYRHFQAGSDTTVWRLAAISSILAFLLLWTANRLSQNWRKG